MQSQAGLGALQCRSLLRCSTGPAWWTWTWQSQSCSLFLATMCFKISDPPFHFLFFHWLIYLSCKYVYAQYLWRCPLFIGVLSISIMKPMLIKIMSCYLFLKSGCNVRQMFSLHPTQNIYFITLILLCKCWYIKCLLFVYSVTLSVYHSGQ